MAIIYLSSLAQGAVDELMGGAEREERRGESERKSLPRRQEKLWKKAGLLTLTCRC